MVWKGINLTGYHQYHWVKKSLFYFWGAILTLLFLMLNAFFIYFWANHFETENENNSREIGIKTSKLKTIEDQIEQYKKHQENKVKTENIKKVDILKMLNFFREGGTKGGIENIYVFVDEVTKIKLVGKFIQQAQFQQLEANLSQMKLNYSIEHFQINDKYQIEFSLVIDMGK